MNKFIEEINGLNNDLLAKHKDKINLIVQKNFEKNPKPKPQTISFPNSSRKFFTENRSECKSILVSAGYNASSKNYIDIPRNMSFPEQKIDFKFYEFGMYNKFNIKPQEKEHILKKIFNITEELYFINFLELERFREITKFVIQEYPDLQKIVIILKELFKIPLKQMKSIFFQIKAEVGKSIESSDEFDFEKLGLFFCRHCGVFLCDIHFNKKIIKGFQLWDEAQLIQEMEFFSPENRLKDTIPVSEDLLKAHQTKMEHNQPKSNEKISIERKKLVSFYINMQVSSPCLISLFTGINCEEIQFMIQNNQDLFKMKFYSTPFLSNDDTEAFGTSSVVILPEENRKKDKNKYHESKTLPNRLSCTCVGGCVPNFKNMNSENQKCACLKEGQFKRKRMSPVFLQMFLSSSSHFWKTASRGVVCLSKYQHQLRSSIKSARSDIQRLSRFVYEDLEFSQIKISNLTNTSGFISES